MPSVQAKAGIAASVIGALCLYELVSYSVNEHLDIDVLPSATQLNPPTVRGAIRRISPPWVRYGGLLAAGLVLGAVSQRRSRPRPAVTPPVAVADPVDDE